MSKPPKIALAKRQAIHRWEATAIPHPEAEARGLVRYSDVVQWRNWSTREALHDFALQSLQAAPVLVRMDGKSMALFTSRR